MPNGAKNGFHRTTVVDRSTVSSSEGGTGSLALTILTHPHLDRTGERAILAGFSQEQPVAISRVEPSFAPPGSSKSEALSDEHLSRKPIRLFYEPGGGVRIDCRESSTSVRVHGQRISASLQVGPEEIARGLVLELGARVVLLLHRMGSVDGVLEGKGSHEGSVEHELVGESQGLRQVLWDIQSVASVELPVLLRGETGTGKELVAHAVHRQSRRRDKPFVAVNLGAISASLAIADLFGAERGSFSSSVQRRIGYFEQANGGTLFLDEIGEAPIELQVALLRTLETGEIQTLGAPHVRKVDVRIIAATDADLEGKIATGSFRAPLLNRLAAYEIKIPPLRERRDDIGRLLMRFLREELANIGELRRLDPPSGDEKPWLSASLVARLADYDWPGNIRQLRNVVRQLVIGNRGRARAEITPTMEGELARPARHAQDENRSPGVPKASPPPSVLTGEKAAPPPEPPPAISTPAPPQKAGRAPTDVLEDELRAALQACRWDFEATSQCLGISRASMYNFKKKYPWFRTATDLSVEQIRACHQNCGGVLAKMAECLEVSERALRRRVRDLGLEAT